MAVCPYTSSAKQNRVANKAPRNKAHEDKDKDWKSNGLTVDICNLNHPITPKTHAKGKPIYKEGKQRLDHRPQRTYGRTFVGFYEFIFRQQKNLPGKALVLPKNLKQIFHILKF